MKVPLSKVYIDDTIRKKILEVVDSGKYILCDESKAFEQELAAFLGVKHVVLSSSWTSVMQLFFTALGIEEGSEILMPSLTAFPSVEPPVHCGLKPVFVDIDDNYLMDRDDVQAKITDKTAVVMPVHLYGNAVDMDALSAICKKKGLLLIEDCAQAIGARFKGGRVGSLAYASGFSFYPSKNLTVFGDGGALAANDPAIADKVKMLRNHGRKEKFTHEEFGFNMRFNDIQAAVGRVQLSVIDRLNAQRARLAGQYRELLRGLPVELPDAAPGAEHVYHMFVIRTKLRDELKQYLADNGISTGIHYPVPVHLQPAVEKRFGKQPSLPKTEAVVNEIVSLPMYPAMTDTEVEYVAEHVHLFFKKQ